ncbi:MAG: DUF998 domain-containing protein [Candidatus Saccharimonadales bacterium]|nr:DUF998 domain-containing protein [Candidatus Saccharimonadales bacterium]
MKELLLFSGFLAALTYIAVTIIGGALRPGYSHLKDTVSELFSPGSPNKRLLNIFLFVYAAFTTAFGFGLWLFVDDSGAASTMGYLAAGFIVLIGVMNFLTGFVFLQDPMGKPMTLSGMMHVALVGIMALISMIAPLHLGFWLSNKGLLPGYDAYSFVSAGLILLGGLSNLAISKLGKPILGLTERITIFFMLQWTAVIAIRLMMF